MSNPDTLFNIVLNLVIKHIDSVESFLGFPSLIGEKIFKTFVSKFDTRKDILLQDVVKKFVDAYENMVLERLNLSKRLIILNEYFEIVIIMSSFLVDLCLCSCSLGSNHEIFNHIANFKRLKKLCLKNNSMSDSSMRLITLPIRMYGIGPKELEILNLSDNNFTDNMITWLSAFPKLQYLNLTGSEISEKSIEVLKVKYFLERVIEEEAFQEIKTEGWGAILIEKLIEKEDQKMKIKHSKCKIRKHFRTIESLISPERRTVAVPLVFRRMSSENISTCELNFSAPAPKKRKYSEYSYVKAIEDDIFCQYK